MPIITYIGVVFSGIAIVRSLLFLFNDDFEGNTNISAVIKSGFTVFVSAHSPTTVLFQAMDNFPLEANLKLRVSFAKPHSHI